MKINKVFLITARGHEQCMTVERILRENDTQIIYVKNLQGSLTDDTVYVVEHTNDAIYKIAEQIESKIVAFEIKTYAKGIEMSEDQYIEVCELLSDEETIKAIKKVREYSDVPLREAKYFVDELKSKFQPTTTRHKNEVRLTDGSHLWWRDNGVGGRTYYSDEVGDGVIVWNTSLVNMPTILKAIEIERVTGERHGYE